MASGMAAVAAAFSLLPHGGTVVVPDAAYNGVMATVADLEAGGAAVVRRVDVTDTAAVVAALPGADLLWLESPTNPLLEVADLAALAAAAREHGVLSVVDNTFATPLLQQPLADGADVVVHSVTKYLAGHSDVLLGAVVTAPTAGGARARVSGCAGTASCTAASPGRWRPGSRCVGCAPCTCASSGPARTPPTSPSGSHGHPAVERVRYPGFGAVVSIEVAGGAQGAERVAAATRVWVHATSLGGVESLLERRRRQPNEPAKVPEELVRLSVGVEDVEDLWRDLSAALDHARGLSHPARLSRSRPCAAGTAGRPRPPARCARAGSSRRPAR